MGNNGDHCSYYVFVWLRHVQGKGREGCPALSGKGLRCPNFGVLCGNGRAYYRYGIVVVTHAGPGMGWRGMVVGRRIWRTA